MLMKENYLSKSKKNIIFWNKKSLYLSWIWNLSFIFKVVKILATTFISFALIYRFFIFSSLYQCWFFEKDLYLARYFCFFLLRAYSTFFIELDYESRLVWDWVWDLLWNPLQKKNNFQPHWNVKSYIYRQFY